MDFIREINRILCSSEEDEEGIERPVRVRRSYRMLARSTVDDYDDVDFRKYFRLSKVAFWHVHGVVRDVLEGDLRRSRELTAENKLLAALRMVACGNFQQTAGDYTGVSQQTVSKILPLVCDAILRHLPTYIRMPQTENERLAKTSAFAEIAGFPRCIGAIDCTHVKIASPGGDISENFRNRHGYFSINVQTISDADLRIMNVIARWPGSAHDTTIFNNCELRQQLERGEYGDYVLVADGGYANTANMCTPFRANVQLNGPQQLYQKAQIATRNVVERSYGLLKRRFPILHFGMQLRRLDLIQKVICLCCVLHNICIDMGDVGDDFQIIANEPAAADRGPVAPQPQGGRRMARDEIVATFAQRMLEGE